MATLTEDYVSFEIAKLLKEKGFNEPCLMCYTSDGKLGNYGHYRSYKNSDVFSLTAPTLQMAIKWLREVYNVNIDIVSVWNQKQFEYQVFVVTPENAKHCYVDDKLYQDYEQACEAGIKYCFENLI